MILKRFYDDQLAHASYMAGCPGSGEAVILDPNRHLDTYLEAAEAEGLRIVGVAETHIHADYVSGSKELAARTGATLYLSDEGTEDWKYAFAGDANVRLVKDGDRLSFGGFSLTVMHTPGHTPEHIAFVLTDRSASDAPVGMFTGDFVFVGDVGRPDLLEKAAGFEGTMRAGGEVLYRSLGKLLGFADETLLWPAHGSGSACGKSLGGMPDTTLGFERRSNWALKTEGADAFVDSVLADQPEPPVYFANMKAVNKLGPAARPAMPVRLGASLLPELLDSATMVIDLREREAIERAAFDGVLALPWGKSFTMWAGSLVSHEDNVVLLARDQVQAHAAASALFAIGIDGVTGWIDVAAGLSLMKAKGHVRPLPMATPREMVELARSGDAEVLDLRKESERTLGCLPGSKHFPLARMRARYRELDLTTPKVVHCASGLRALIGATFLLRAGFSVRAMVDSYASVERELAASV